MNEDKEKMLKLTTDQIESKFGKGSIMTLGEGGADLNIGVIPTGALPLDAALGIGGVPRGRIIEIYGPESSGKTTLALQILAEAQALGGIVAFIDAEHALDPVYAARIGVDINEVLISQPDTGEQALEICDMLVRSGAIDCVIVDSVAALVPRAEIEGEMGDTTVGLQARLMSQALRKLAGSLSKSNTTCIFINQLREKIGVMFGNPETTTGGRALKFFSSVRIDIRRIDSIKQNGDVVGNRVRAKVVKNKVAPPFRQAEFDLMYGEGISREGCIVDMAVECGVAKKSGAWYTYGEERLGQGREAAKQTLKENPDLREELEEQGPRGLRDPRHRAPGRKRVVHAGAQERQEEIAHRGVQGRHTRSAQGGYRRLGSRPFLRGAVPASRRLAVPCRGRRRLRQGCRDILRAGSRTFLSRGRAGERSERRGGKDGPRRVPEDPPMGRGSRALHGLPARAPAEGRLSCGSGGGGPSARPARTGGGRSTLRRRPRPHEACGRAGASRCRTGDRGARHRPSHPRFLGRARAEGEGLRSGPRPGRPAASAA